jgi:glutathione-specific gamma-glutamylcyclotransferase
MWSPGFAPSAIHPARVFGWHRRFSRVSVTSWGSPDKPGLCAALHARGTAWGRILEIPAQGRADIIAYLDERERAYLHRPVRVDALIGGGLRRLAAFTYVANSADPTLAPALEPELARRYALGGVGTKGAAYDYIRSTMAALAEDGHTTSDAHRFFAMIAG